MRDFPMNANSKAQKARAQKAMAYAMEHPTRRGWGETPPGESTSLNLRNEIWRCRAVLRHSRVLAERVLDGSITLGEAFREAQQTQAQKSMPSLPALNSMRVPVDEIAPAELNEFIRIFG
jgi:hypothetical protein